MKQRDVLAGGEARQDRQRIRAGKRVSAGDGEIELHRVEFNRCRPAWVYCSGRDLLIRVRPSFCLRPTAAVFPASAAAMSRAVVSFVAPVKLLTGKTKRLIVVWAGPSSSR